MSILEDLKEADARGVTLSFLNERMTVRVHEGLIHTWDRCTRVRYVTTKEKTLKLNKVRGMDLCPECSDMGVREHEDGERYYGALYYVSAGRKVQAVHAAIKQDSASRLLHASKDLRRHSEQRRYKTSKLDQVHQDQVKELLDTTNNMVREHLRGQGGGQLHREAAAGLVESACPSVQELRRIHGTAGKKLQQQLHAAWRRGVTNEDGLSPSEVLAKRLGRYGHAEDTTEQLKLLHEALATWDRRHQEALADKTMVLVGHTKSRLSGSISGDLLVATYGYEGPHGTLLCMPASVARWSVLKGEDPRNTTDLGEVLPSDTPAVYETTAALWDPRSTGDMRDWKNALEAGRAV